MKLTTASKYNKGKYNTKICNKIKENTTEKRKHLEQDAN